MPGEDELFQMELNLHPNEASGLLMIGNQELLEEHGWDLGGSGRAWMRVRSRIASPPSATIAATLTRRLGDRAAARRGQWRRG